MNAATDECLPLSKGVSGEGAVSFVLVFETFFGVGRYLSLFSRCSSFKGTKKLYCWFGTVLAP